MEDCALQQVLTHGMGIHTTMRLGTDMSGMSIDGRKRVECAPCVFCTV